jgi:hypothetical protein
MGGKSDYLENKVLDHILGATSYTPPTNIYIALFTTLPNDAGSGGVEVSGGSYARYNITNNTTNFPNASGGVKSNNANYNFPTATANWGTIVGFGLYDDPTAGNLLFHGPLYQPSPKMCYADASDLISCPAHGFTAGMTVRFQTIPEGSLPAGLSEATLYYVIATGLVTDGFKVSTTLGGSAVNITATGVARVNEVREKVVNNGDTLTVPIGAIVITED